MTQETNKQTSPTPASAGHTATPWRADEYPHETRGTQDMRLSIHASSPDGTAGRFIADCRCMLDERGLTDESRANAAHIVACVNSHDALISENKRLREALEACEDRLTAWQAGGVLQIESTLGALSLARAALGGRS